LLTILGQLADGTNTDFNFFATTGPSWPKAVRHTSASAGTRLAPLTDWGWIVRKTVATGQKAVPAGLELVHFGGEKWTTGSVAR
jgi:hypothetical protein